MKSSWRQWVSIVAVAVGIIGLLVGTIKLVTSGGGAGSVLLLLFGGSMIGVARMARQTGERDEESPSEPEVDEPSTPDVPQPDAQLHRLELESGTERLQYAPDSTRLAARGRRGEIALQSPDFDGRARRLAEHDPEGGESLVAWSPEGEHVAIASREGDLRLVDVGSGESVAARSFDLEPCSLALLDSNRGRVAIGDDVGRIWIAELRSETEPTLLDEHEETVHHLVRTESPRRLVSGSRDGTVRLWRIDDATVDACWDCPLQIVEHDVDLEDVVASGDRLAVRASHRTERREDSPGVSNTIRVWDLEASREALCLMGERVESARAIALGDGVDRLVVALLDGIRCIDVESGREEFSDPLASDDTLHTLDLDSAGEQLATGSERGTVRIWEFEALRGSTSPEASSDGAAHPSESSHPSNRLRLPLAPRERSIVGGEDSLTDLHVAPWWPRSTSRGGFRVYELSTLRRALHRYGTSLEHVARRAAERLRARRSDVDQLQQSLDQTKNRSANISADPSAIDDGDVGSALKERQEAERETSSGVEGRAESIRELTSELQSHRQTIQKFETFALSAIELYRAVAARLFQRTLQTRFAVHLDALARRLEGLSVEALEHEASDEARADRLGTWSEVLEMAADFVDDRRHALEPWAERREEKRLHDVDELDDALADSLRDKTLSTEGDDEESLVPEDVREADRQVFEARRQSYATLYESLVDALRDRADSLAESASILRRDEDDSDDASESEGTEAESKNDDGFGGSSLGESETAEHRKPNFDLELEVTAGGFESGATQLLSQYGRSNLDATGEGPPSYAEALERIAERTHRADPIGGGDEGEDDRPELDVVEALVDGEEVERVDLHDWTGRVQRIVSSWIG